MRSKASVRLAAIGLVLSLLGVTAVHAWAIEAFPAHQLWGDETHYLRTGIEQAEAGETSLLPGTLRFDHRPELASRVVARLARSGRRGGELFRAASVLNLVLLAALLVLTYAQGLLLGMGRLAALVPLLLVGLTPWFAFHVHTLWPEVLHATLFAALGACLFAYARRPAGWLLLPAGIAAGYAALTKGVLLPFLPLVAGFLVLVTRTAAPDGERRPWGRALLPAGIFLGALALVLVPQLRANAAAGHGWRLGANRWWNLELGLTLPAEAMGAAGAARWARNMEVNVAYLAATESVVERERLARERVLAYLGEVGLFGALGAQTRKLARLVFADASSFEQSLGFRERWGPAPPPGLTWLRLPARLAWYLLLVGGAAGAALVGGRSPGWTLLVLFTGYYLAAAFLIPVKVRFLMPLVPVLALLTGAALERGVTLLRARRAARAEEAVNSPAPVAAP